MDNIALRVLKAPDGSSLLGTVHEIGHRTAVIGRSPTCELTLPERTISSRHVKLSLGPPLTLEVLTNSSGTFLNRQPVEQGQIVQVRPGDRLQVGGVLLVVEVSVTQSMRQPMGSGLLSLLDEPPLQVRFDLGEVLCEWRGWDMGLTGDAARFLGVLARNVGRPVSYVDLRDADVVTKQLAPLATRVRRAFVVGIDGGHIDRQLLKSRLQGVSVELGAEMSDDKLMLKLLDNRTDYGYRLRLLKDDVSIVS